MSHRLWSLVHDGSLPPRGMPRFERLDAGQVGKIHGHFRQMARDALTI
jgi:hypothetical protein